ncbi:hypothetical protein QMK33_08600 [Hymenobacter sp. H14-R3]|uniref:hypothetical protein n=1 Tax=Hymenobacter sp. H14-R3 TaxID=3046308 RepID=UPI0024BBD7AF|nr:hypothetical protein [Hymenobacter sp. H14-R3]MDJ0365210.1 hypothetical protein [Hymenobacter sp. H14-R3]
MKQTSFSAVASGQVLVRATAAGQLPAGPALPPAFAPFLYFEPAHQELQRHEHPVLAFFLEDDARARTVAQLYVVPDAAGPGQARSPAQATFGGAQLAAGVRLPQVHQLLDQAESTLRAHGQQTLEIRGYPFCYDPAGAATLAEALRVRGYAVRLAEQNYYLDLDRDYEAHLHPAARRRLRACHRAGLVLEQEPPLLLPWAYDFLAACRAERGQPALSLSLERVQELFRLFPRECVLLSVREPGSGKWAALTMAIKASERVLHNFYPASPLAFNKLSPAVLLTAGLHQLGRDLGLHVLDLGRSTLGNREPHESLLRFKRHLGGVASLKLTWSKML